MSNPATKALMVICDDGMIVKSALILSDGVSSVADGLKEVNFVDLIDRSHPANLEEMLEKIRRGQVSSGIELLLNLGQGSVAMRFFAGKVDSRFILVGGETLDDVISIMDADAVSNDLEIALCVRGLKIRMLLFPSMSSPDISLLDEMSRLNNEIVNSSRELAKRNKELFLEREKDRVTIASIGDAVVVTDHLLRVTLMNQMAQDLTGWKMDDAIGSKVEEVIRFVVGGAQKPLNDIFKTSFERGQIMTLPAKCMLMDRDGTLRPVDDSISPILDPSGKALGLVIIFRDITKRLRMEQRLMELNDVMHLINKTMRHDILNDLTTASGALQLFRLKREERGLEMAERSILRCQKTIEDMRALESGTSSGRDLGRYDIRQVVQQVMISFDLPYQLDGKTAQVLADDALSSVLENLVRNAIIHGRTDRIDISISEGNGKCVLSVMDRGKGIPDDIKSRIFEEGYSHGESGGTGLGLYIIKKVMDRYGGSVGVRDNVPSGAIFDLSFRMA
jgi:PAS domain S-box-containing protein